MRLDLEVNGTTTRIDCRPGAALLTVLREAGFFGVKHGCETGECGACLVLVNGSPRLSCLMPAVRTAGQDIVTVEALGDFETLHPLQRAFLERGAVQCGYCTPAMLLAAAALLRRDPHASESARRQALAGVLCRCTGYTKPLEAIRVASDGDTADIGIDKEGG